MPTHDTFTLQTLAASAPVPARVAATSLWRTPDLAAAAEGISCRLGDGACARAHAGALSRRQRGGDAAIHRSLLRLQCQFGNQYVGQVLRQAVGTSAQDPLEHVERSIGQARGGGQAMDHGTRSRMESSFGADFSRVRIHTDARADQLSQAISARAFATGHDVFFRQGEYNPGTSVGRELLAHELTHVVQQTGTGVHAKLTVSQPNDPHEVEADRVASAIMKAEHAPVADDEEKTKEQK